MWEDDMAVAAVERLGLIIGGEQRQARSGATFETIDPSNSQPLAVVAQAGPEDIDEAVAARYFEFYAGVADKLMGNTIPLGPGFLDYTVKEPVGVSGHIVPWNYPIQIGARGAAPALAAGCCVVM